MISFSPSRVLCERYCELLKVSHPEAQSILLPFLGPFNMPPSFGDGVWGICVVLHYFLAQQNVAASPGTFPAPALELATSLRNPDAF